MHAIRVLSAILAIQAQALSLGAPVQQEADRTQATLYSYLDRLPEELMPRAAPEEPSQPPEEAPQSAWDPEPHDVVLEASKCRALLLEVIRRAAHDWVLYRNTRKPERAYAADAHIWLFEEEPAKDGKPAHPAWEERRRAGEPLLAFVTVCELLDLDPEVVRERVRRMTAKDITTAGRPAEHRRSRQPEGVEDFTSPGQLDIISLDDPSFESSYEAHFAVACLGGN